MVDSAAPTSLTGDKHVKFLVKVGDNVPGTSDNRNELNSHIENGGMKVQFSEGDERYYYDEFRLDGVTFDGGYPSVVQLYPDGGSKSLNNWHNIFQFHTVGLCASSAEPLEFTFNNYVSDGGLDPKHYYFEVAHLTAYDQVPSVGGDSPYEYEWPNPRPAVQADHWYYMVMHVKWSADSAVGLIEIWIDGQLQFGKHLATLQRWSTNCYDPATYATACTCNSILNLPEDQSYVPHFTDQAVPVFFKSGHYRNEQIREDQYLWHGGYEMGQTCGAVWPTAVSSTTCPLPDGGAEP